MLSTEEQAQKLVCHRTRGARCIGYCLGSKCMTWEWKKYGITMIEGNKIGYCSDLPGRPEE